jgi:hypothetical protein
MRKLHAGVNIRGFPPRGRSRAFGHGSGTILGRMREPPPPVFTNRLQCVECGRVSLEDERGWTARLTDDDEVAVYCPDCDERA